MHWKSFFNPVTTLWILIKSWGQWRFAHLIQAPGNPDQDKVVTKDE